MQPISNVDRLVVLLRRRLTEKGRPSARKGGMGRGSTPAPAGFDAVQALAAVDGVDDRQLGRALIQNMLSEQFGAAMLNEPRFQQVVDRVTDTIREDSEAGKLLERVVAELRTAAR